jgi:hypothetical protein
MKPAAPVMRTCIPAGVRYPQSATAVKADLLTGARDVVDPSLDAVYAISQCDAIVRVIQQLFCKQLADETGCASDEDMHFLELKIASDLMRMRRES